MERDEVRWGAIELGRELGERASSLRFLLDSEIPDSRAFTRALMIEFRESGLSVLVAELVGGKLGVEWPAVLCQGGDV
jgi:hypothetical protein